MVGGGIGGGNNEVPKVKLRTIRIKYLKWSCQKSSECYHRPIRRGFITWRHSYKCSFVAHDLVLSCFCRNHTTLLKCSEIMSEMFRLKCLILFFLYMGNNSCGKRESNIRLFHENFVVLPQILMGFKYRVSKNVMFSLQFVNLCFTVFAQSQNAMSAIYPLVYCIDVHTNVWGSVL